MCGRLRLSLIVAVGVFVATARPVSGVAGFGDVEPDRYYTEPIQWMVDHEITTGTSPLCFSPDGPVTRGEAAAFLWRMEGEPSAEPHPFDDVSRDWQQGPVSWLYAEEITTGTSATTFSPDDTLSRGQFAALLHRLESPPTTEVDHPFVDVTAGWQQEPVSWLYASGITVGTSATEYSPAESVTRGEIATFLHRYQGDPAVTVDPNGSGCGAPVAVGTGFSSLFIGHSFFRPMAEQMADLAPAAGFTDHEQSVVFAGGPNGAPMGLWQQPGKRAEIQAVLDTGTVELFTMTYHPDHPTLEGYRNWIDYAMGANPDTVIAVAMPWVTDPVTYSATEYAAAVDQAYPLVAQRLIDDLRAEYPDTTFFLIPYGLGAADLYTLWDAGDLPDVSELVGSNGSGIFRDGFGHADLILEDLSSLIWLGAIYDVDLASFDAGSGWSTDLSAIADAILDAHDSAYDAPWR